MKKIIILALIACCMMGIDARVNPTSKRDKSADIDAVMAEAKLKFTQGTNNVFLPDDNTRWRNGMYYCHVENYYDKHDNAVGRAFYLNYYDEKLSSKHYYEVKLVKDKPTVVNLKGVTVKHEVAGRWDMIVFRNSSGAVLDVILKKKDVYDDGTVDDLRDIINGVYAGTGKNASDSVVFGAVYGDKGYRLPGADYKLEYQEFDERPKLFDKFRVAYFPERMKRVHMPVPTMEVDDNGVTHYYGDGKEITRDEYEYLRSTPNGFGGHGSLHGPLWWLVKPQGDGLAVELTGPFQEELDAFYSNFRDETFTLNWVRSPYKDMKDRWAVLSMRPVTRGMLHLCDKTMLQQMLKYLNARKNPTDIENLNKSLINTMVNGAATPKKKGKKRR